MAKKIARVLFFIFLGLFWMIRLFQTESQESNLPDDMVLCDEWIDTDSLSLARYHQRSWVEYTENGRFCMQYAVDYEAAQHASIDRENYEIPEWQTDDEFWGDVYRMLYQHDRENLGQLQDSLLSIQSANQLDRDAFAKMVVAFVQDIPYNYVMPKGCEGYDRHPCVPNMRFGIFSPLEFLYQLQGDCDTRTVLLFTLLSNLGYDPVIVNSVEYGHSMLALDIATSGDFLVHQGKQYAFWETTNVGWLPGMIPPDMQNKKYWNVVLDNQSR